MKGNGGKGGWLLVTVVLCPALLPACSPGASEEPAEEVQADLGPEAVEPEAVLLDCPDGPNPDGNGCFLPCQSGWHDGLEGHCHIDCPEGSQADETGRCMGAVCKEGFETLDWSGTMAGVQLAGSVCMPDCPPGMVAQGKGFDIRCHLPCGEGWKKGKDGRCRRECPEGMAEDGEGECSLVAVGERKICPPGKYDESFTGPNPLHVDGQDQSPGNPDGSVAHPFRSIGDAVQAGKLKGLNEMTIMVAAGEYDEQVVASDLAEFHLVGACAAQVTVTAQELETVNGKTSAAIDINEVERVTVAGLTVRSNQRAVKILKKDFDAQATAAVRDVAVLDAGFIGIGVQNRFGKVEVQDCTVDGAVDLGIMIAGMEVVQSPAVATVAGNLVTHVVPCEGQDYCLDDPAVVGIMVVSVAALDLAGNRVADMDHAQGVITTDIAESRVTNNEFRDLAGIAALNLTASAGGTLEVRDNVVFDGTPAQWDNKAADAFLAIAMVGHQPLKGVMVRDNIVRRVSGNGISSFNVGETKTLIEGNELSEMLVGMMVEGSVEIAANRVYDVRIALTSSKAEGPVELAGNEFRDSRDEDFGVVGTERLENAHKADFRLGIEATHGLSLTGNRFADVGGFAKSAVLIHSETIAPGLQVTDNVFENNAGISLASSGTASVHMTGNRWVGTEPEQSGAPFDDRNPQCGLWLVSQSAEDHNEVVLADNLFQDYGNGAAVVFSHLPMGNRNYRLESNLFRNAGSVTLVEMEGFGAESIMLVGNTLMGTMVNLEHVKTVTVSENRFIASDVVRGLFPSFGGATFSRNLFASSSLVLGQGQKGTVVEQNEFDRAVGFGLLVAANPGKVYVTGNIFFGTAQWSWTGIGNTGDGLHVSGTEELGRSDVEVRKNRFENNARLGFLVSGSAALAEQNSYSGNGHECNGQCDLVVQFEPVNEGLAVSGEELTFAARPSQSFSVLTVEDALE